MKRIVVVEDRPWMTINATVDWYKLDDVVFLMDYDLKGDMGTDDFFQRINIKYALEKRKEHAEEKIWFYTTGGADVRTALLGNFPDNVIRVTKFINDQLEWDKDSIKRIVEG